MERQSLWFKSWWSTAGVTGIATENAVILINDVFQGPVKNYNLEEKAGVTTCYLYWNSIFSF